MVEVPTGCGKSRTMRALVHRLVAERRRVMVALPTEEILQQFENDLRRETRVPFYREKAQDVAPPAALITLASHQTLWRRLHRHPRSTVLLFDEAHHGNEEALRNLDTVDSFLQVLGFSASPWSPACTEVFGQVIYRYGLQSAIREGYLCRYELWPFPDLVPRPGGFELYYCESNEVARELAQRTGAGAAYLGHDSRDRAELVEGFRAGRVLRLYLNRMLVEGFDCSAVNTIYLDKAPESELLVYQMIGRGLRRKVNGRGLVVYARDLAGVRQALERAG